MITFTPKTDVPPALDETEENRFERIRKAAAERHRKSDTDTPPRSTDSRGHERTTTDDGMEKGRRTPLQDGTIRKVARAARSAG